LIVTYWYFYENTLTTQSLPLCNMKIYPLSEGNFTIGHDKIFHPFDEAKDNLNDRAIGSLLVEVQPFLVVAGNDVIVCDTGLGFTNDESIPQIHTNLKSIGFEPEEVTKVLMSHLHKDHAGGLVFKNTNSQYVPTFPNADIYIYRQEADFALQKGYPSYIPEEIEPILSSGQVIWLEGEEGIIDNYIKYFHSGGHSPQHIVYLIEADGEKVFFGGDEAPQLKQLKMKYVAKYDFDGKKAMELRAQYAEQGKAENWQFLFYHDIKTPTGQL
jgi:glyoxylase-like metal-dependent hydrolase (beta-lactamase superfamily II)